MKAFQQNLNKNSRIKDLQKKLLSAKNLNGNEAELYSVEVGQALAKAFHDEINADTLPDGRMYYNIASRVIPPPMQKCYVDIADYAQAMYQGLNERAGLGLKAQRAKFNEDRIKGLIEYACGADEYANRQKNFEGSLVNFAQSVSTDTTKTNAEFHYDAGLSPVIRRIANAGCCKWCANLAGTYDYPIDFAYDKDPYPRHRDCRCQVLYDPGNGKVQDVHTKQWQTDPMMKYTGTSLDKNLIPLSKSNFFNRLDEGGLFDRANKVLEESGFDDIFIHGDKYGFAFKDADGNEANVSVHELADMIIKNGLSKEESIRLCACEAGKDEGYAAQALANILRKPVKAPNKKIWLTPPNKQGNCDIIIADEIVVDGIETADMNSIGEWITFYPE